MEHNTLNTPGTSAPSLELSTTHTQLVKTSSESEFDLIGRCQGSTSSTVQRDSHATGQESETVSPREIHTSLEADSIETLPSSLETSLEARIVARLEAKIGAKLRAEFEANFEEKVKVAIVEQLETRLNETLAEMRLSIPELSGVPPSEDNPAANEAARSRLMEFLQIKSQLMCLQKQQDAAANAIPRILTDNRRLFEQSMAFQTLHDRHENSINAILTFLATVYNRSLDGQNIAQMSGIFSDPVQQPDVSHQEESEEAGGQKTMKPVDIESTRKGAVTLLVRGLQASIPIAIQNGVYILGKDDTIDSKAKRLAIEIENAVHQSHQSKGSANQQNRAIAAKLKCNQALCNGLLTKTLSPATLAAMTSDDMAGKEQKETADMKARADKRTQSIMITDGGRRMRRTRKGDEFIEGDNFAIPNKSTTMSTSQHDRENSPGNEVDLLANIDDYRSQDNIRSHVILKQPLNIATKQLPARKASTQDFDIQKVFSSIQSPINVHYNRQPSGVIAPAPFNRQERDPYIDKLLTDDKGNESLPYSLAEYNPDLDIIWRGTVTMDPIARFPVVAKQVGGTNMSKTVSWTDILQKELRVADRIDREKANAYLCSLQYSPLTDIVVVNIILTREAVAQSFQELYQYFQSREKYGVLTNKGAGNIHTIYLIPVPPSPANLPDFLTNLKGHRVPENRPEPLILVTLVICSEYQPGNNQQSSDANAKARSPSVMGRPQCQMSMSGTGPARSPMAPQGAFGAPPSAEQATHPQFSSGRQQQSVEVAVGILGDYIEAPTVIVLLPQAWQMRPVEWRAIKEILQEDERARNDLKHLSDVLEAKMAKQAQK